MKRGGGKPKRKRVVIGGHSGGACHTCRQRKVKCDESRPFCQRCALAGRQCLGYRSAVLSLGDDEKSQACIATDDSLLSTDLKQGDRSPKDEHTRDTTLIKNEPGNSPSLWQATLAQVYAEPGWAASKVDELDTRPLEQLQMLSLVLEDHFPSSRPESTFAKRASYLCRLPAMDLSSSLVSNAVDSLCLAHFGSRNKNESHLVASRVFYGNALSALSRVIQSGKEHGHTPRMIIATIMMISLYDESLPLNHRQNNDWETHYWGIHEFLKRFGPSALNFQHEFDLRLYQNLRTPLYFLALTRRKALVFAQPEWRDATNFSQSARIYTKVSRDWYALAAPLPGLLEEADREMEYARLDRSTSLTTIKERGPARSDQPLTVFRRLERLKEELLLCLLEENKISDQRIITLANANAFDTSIEEHVFVTSSGLFRDFVYYPDGTMIMRAAVIYLSCLIAECTLHGLLSSGNGIESQTLDLDKSLASIEHNAFCRAKDLCSTVYGYSKLSSIAHAHFLYTILLVVRAFFLEHGALDEVEWTWNCMVATRARMKRLEKTEPPTLCRITSVSANLEPLLQSVRYRQLMP